MWKRGAEFRSSSAVTVLLIGTVIILYVLFLPPAEREALLSGTPQTPYYGSGGSGGYGGVGVSGGVMLMDKYVGTLLALGSDSTSHAIPTTTVFTVDNTEEIKFIDSMRVKRGAFSQEDATLAFRADLGVTKNYLLTFNVDPGAKGPLSIDLNGYPIFEREIGTRSPDPIPLPLEYLRPENVLTFTVSGTGWAFWEANGYTLRNILVSADVRRYEASSAEQHFTVTPDEYLSMDKGTLEFVPQCDPRQAGRLTVSLNGQSLYTGFIDCGVLIRQDVAKELLSPGDNRVGFTSNEGSYTVDRIKFVTQRKQQEYPVFYFNLPPDMFQQANAFAGQVVMTLRFTEGNTLKQGSVIVNGYQDSFSTQSYYYQATLDPNVLIPNANSVQIVPQGSNLNVAELRVELLG